MSQTPVEVPLVEIDCAEKVPVLTKNLVTILIQPSSKLSFAWKHVGKIVMKTGQKRCSDRWYCKPCFDALPDDTTDSLQKVHSWTKSSATGNFKNHLRDKHNLSEGTGKKLQDTLSKTWFNAAPPSSTASTSTASSQPSQKTHVEPLSSLKFEIALMCCRDLLPFTSSEKDGFAGFLYGRRIVRSPEEIPNRTTVTNATKVMAVFGREKVRTLLTPDIASTCSITADMGQDPAHRNSYLSVTGHFLSEDFEPHRLLLDLKHLTEAHTGEHIRDEITDIIGCHAIDPSACSMTRDCGSNIKKASRLMGVRYDRPCCGHGLHNLVVVDAISQSTPVRNLTAQCSALLTALMYKTDEILKETNEPTVQDKAMMEEIGNLFDTVIEPDNDDPIQLIPLEEEFRNPPTVEAESEADASDPPAVDVDFLPVELHFPTNVTNTNNAAYSSQSVAVQSTTTMDRATKNRWNSDLKMWRTIVRNHNATTKILAKIGKVNLVLSRSKASVFVDSFFLDWSSYTPASRISHAFCINHALMHSTHTRCTEPMHDLSMNRPYETQWQGATLYFILSEVLIF